MAALNFRDFLLLNYTIFDGDQTFGEAFLEFGELVFEESELLFDDIGPFALFFLGIYLI
jgi:hypothetical protein